MASDQTVRVEFGDELPVLPLRNVVVFPYMVIPLFVGREKSMAALEEAMLRDRIVLLVAQKNEKSDEPTPDELYEVGTAAEIKQLFKLPDGTIRMLVEGVVRVKVKGFTQKEPFFKATIEKVNDVSEKTPEIEAMMRSLLYNFEQYMKLSKKVPPETMMSIVGIDDPARLADIIGAHLELKVEDKQQILEAFSAKERLEAITAIILREVEVLEIERKIHSRVRKQMEKTQKEYYLREQMKAIQKELGEKDERQAEADEFREKVEKIKFPEEVKEKVLKEIDRLEKMPPMAAESAVIRNYLETIIALPWDKKTEDRIDIKAAENILDEDHFGLEKVKERILEYLAVCKLAKRLKGPILCLVGPPGVGKTSLARSIARAVERKFVRISLGGVRDEAEIRGHRRTYVGAMPGRIIQGMRQAGSKNPVFLLDEIDKMSTDFRGDPSAALLEVLDPEQNNSFSDHYLELPFDLSEVLFITTANVLHTIPRPLLDRMEVIHIPGYTEEEKVQIGNRFLLPKQIKEHGLEEDQLVVGTSALEQVIREYTRESGVRNLERNIASICRKAAKEIVDGVKPPIKMTSQKVNKYLGIPKYRHGVAGKESEAGVATGLAWTEMGGEILSIEVTMMRGKGSLTLTGKLGDVMRESAQAALSYIRSRAKKLGIEEDFNEKYDLHIHVPEGAIPKDGPSAGITMATALASALTSHPVSNEIAMTGEITLRGKVLPVGGIKEKVLAAHRAGIKKIILSAENKKDIDDIPQNVRKKLKFVLVESMDEVLENALREKKDED